MKSSFEKSYKKLDSTIKKTSQDEFFASFMNSIKGGTTVLAHKSINDIKIFDMDWVDKIRSYLIQIEKVIYNPKKFIKDVSEIVPIEMVRKTSKDSIVHLSRNTHLIRDVRDNEVVPSKLKTSFKEEELEIYENLFINTLINKTLLFCEIRYQKILENLESCKSQVLDMGSKFDFKDTSFNIKLNIEIKENLKNTELQRNNMEILKKIEELRDYIGNLKQTKFLRSLQNSKKVNPPIMKTNIIMKVPGYKAGYQLWIFMDTYDSLGYEVDQSVKELLFDDKYLEDLYSVLMYSSVTPLYNLERKENDYDLLPERLKKEKSIKVKQDNILEYKVNEDILMSDNSISELFYDKIRKKIRSTFKNFIEDDNTLLGSYSGVVRDLLLINDSICHEIIDENILDNYKEKLKLLQIEKKAKLNNINKINELIDAEKINGKISVVNAQYLLRIEKNKAKFKNKKSILKEEIKTIVDLKNELKINKMNKEQIDIYKEKLVKLREDLALIEKNQASFLLKEEQDYKNKVKVIKNVKKK